ncbi:polymorphic outer membrane protein [Alcanivorax nanhaiticus]|uniref:Polymorphic outer membrane protein n=1 Tax=Alcanivorax nanhaiticus TaxID=1177154 RepID=A0A095SPZ7_9GAMM|nr:choice-of-anchor Q domain-containing protein [Alcanivorax nanhaiticus]KGD66429.1 polymorphic outer membrane protein [Alcanivorax nanhaiticus]
MRHLGLWQSLAGCSLLFAASSHATVYNINSTSDPEVIVEAVDNDASDPAWDAGTEWQVTYISGAKDGFCSLREAVLASNYRISIDGCAAGTGTDSIRLRENSTYLLEHGSLSVGSGQRIVYEYAPDPDDSDKEIIVGAEIEDQPAQIAITIQLDAFEDALDKVRPIISASSNSRVFIVDEGGVLSLANVELIDGNAAGPDADSNIADSNGGLIRAIGPVIVNSNVRLAGGEADNGGAVYMSEGSGMAFQTGGHFENNLAHQMGSVIATSDTFNGSIIGYDFYMANNQAGGGVDAGVIYLAGGDPGADAIPEDTSVVPPIPAVPAVPAVRIGLELGNGTITGNTGGVINVVSKNYTSALVNMTIAFNDGVALTLEETVFNDPADAEITDNILHTVMVGNSDGACAGPGLVDGTAVNAAAQARLLYTITDDDTNCPKPEDWELGINVTDEPNQAEEDVFLGEGRVACTIGIKGAGACLPMSAEEIDGPYPGFLPNPLPAAVEANPLAIPGAPSLFDRANPENVSTDLCESTDNRGKTRGGAGGRCDVGAVEFLRAQAQPEEVLLVSGQSVLADVVANDLNDTEIDCFRLNDIVVSEGTCSIGDTACIEQAVLDRCLTVIEFPSLGSAVPVIDSNGYPKIRYTPSSNFHGVDQIRYLVDKDAFFGGADLGQNQDEITNFFAEPASGLTEKESIGSLGGFMGLMIVLAGVARRLRGGLRGLAAVAMLAAAAQTQAVEIKVNSLADHVPPIKNDGRCTLREALLNAGEAGSPDCAYGGNSTDTILLPAGDIQLVDTLIVQGGGVEIVGKGAYEDPNDDEDDTLTRILGDGSFRLFEVRPPNGSSGHPSVLFQFLTLEKGFASGNGTDGAGSGAVIITGGSVIFDRVRILDNEAEANGGVVFIRANAGNQKLLSFNRSFVSGNVAGVSGGVMSSEARNETFKMALVDSTFHNNSATQQGGVLDVNMPAGELQIANSTFVSNSVAAGTGVGSVLELGELTVNANIMNSTFLDNTGGSAIDLGDAASEVRMSNSAYFNSGDTCSSGATTLLESEYNAYSGLACVADTASTTDQSSTGVASLETSLSSLEGEGVAGDYLPPYLAIANAPTDLVLVDMGNDQADPASGTSSVMACRATDLRGIARTAGERCDVGAFEYQQITADDDEGSNQNTPSSQVPVDILANDLPSDNAEFALLDETGTPVKFDLYKFTFEHAEWDTSVDPEKYVGTNEEYVQDDSLDGEPTLFTLASSDASLDGATLQFVWLYYNENRSGYDLKCGEPIPSHIISANPSLFEPGDVADECVVLFTPPAVPEFDDRLCASTSEDPLEVAFLYSFIDSAGEQSNEATAVMTIKDKPPTMKGQSVLNQPGKKVVFKLDIEDPDTPDAPIDWTRYDITVASEPSFAKRDEDGQTLGTGLIIEDRYDADSLPHSDPADADRRAIVTYVPDSNYNTFKDVFTLKVEDMLCGGSSQQVRFTISYENEETSAGSGSMGWMILGSLVLLLRRRFAA